MKDDDKPPIWVCSTPRQAGKSYFYEWFKRQMEESEGFKSNMWMCVDWAKGGGMNRGDVIKREGNITHVRFRTVAE